MGRRWGKTVLGGSLSLGTASQGGKVAWVVPIYKNGRSLWRWCESTIAPVRAAGIASVNRAERMIEFENGGYLGVYSADNEDAIRNENFNLVVLDEAARISETAWREAIQPTLADVNGDAILISTPRGRNWFWEEYQRGVMDGKDIASWTAPSRDNPNPNIQRAYWKAKTLIPELSWRQEWNGEFVDAEGSVFRRIQEAAHAQLIDAPVKRHSYSAGVDVASSVDYTVVCVMDNTTHELVYMDRFHRVDYPVLEERLFAIYKRFKLQSMTIESNSIGQGVIDHLSARGIPVIPFVTTSATKQAIITGLQAAFEHGEIGIPDDPVLLGELLSFESKRSASGSFTYSAPEGMHDDCVMALAIAWQSISSGPYIIFGA